MTEEELNDLIARHEGDRVESLEALGYVNRYGRGVIRAQDALATNGNPAAEFQFDAGYVLAVVRSRA